MTYIEDKLYFQLSIILVFLNTVFILPLQGRSFSTTSPKPIQGTRGKIRTILKIILSVKKLNRKKIDQNVTEKKSFAIRSKKKIRKSSNKLRWSEKFLFLQFMWILHAKQIIHIYWDFVSLKDKKKCWVFNICVFCVIVEIKNDFFLNWLCLFSRPEKLNST